MSGLSRVPPVSYHARTGPWLWRSSRLPCGPFPARTSGSPWTVWHESRTLAELDQDTVNQQVVWLGTVIGSHGLPRIILECQLQLLHRELCERVPARHDVYARLLVASQLLHSRRTARLPDEQSSSTRRPHGLRR